jgi:hypothetical protein
MAASNGAPANQVDYSQLFPTSGQLSQFAPMSYQEFGAVPYVNPALSTAAKVDNSQLPGALSAYEQQLQTSLAPTFQQQGQQMTADLASRGLLDSSAAAQAQGNLQGNQAAALAGGIEPLIGKFADFYNSNNQLNASNEQQTGVQNQSALNVGNAYNSELYKSVTSGNQQDQNGYLKALWDLQNGSNTGLANGVLGSYDPNNNGTTSILGQGLQNAGNAYSNAYAAGGPAASAFANSLGQLASGFASKATPATKPQSTPDYSGIETYGSGAGVYA